MCGTGFADVPDQTAWYDSFYAKYAKYATDVIDDWSRNKADAITDRIGEYVAPGSRIIDVGCGAGALVQSLNARGFDALGCDIPIPHNLGWFDAVCMTGVLEHVWNIDRLMRTVLDLLRPDGVVYIEVPDAARYMNPYLAPFEDFNTEHVNHFSHWALRLIAQRFGFHTAVSHTRVVEVAPGYRAAYVVTAWKNDGRVDPVLRQSLMAYAERSATEMRHIDEHLEKSLGYHKTFAMWGAGEFAYKLLATNALMNRTLGVIVDENTARRGQSFGGVAVMEPHNLVGSTTPIVVASQIRQEAIVKAAQNLGVEHRLVLP